MSPKQAFQKGFRHILDLAELNDVVDVFLDDDNDPRALRLIEAWRRGALTAKAMLEKEQATLH